SLPTRRSSDLGFGFAYAAVSEPAIVITPFVLFLIQFVWQFPHFWAIAWVSDEDYKKEGIRLLPTTKKDKISATTIFFSCILMLRSEERRVGKECRIGW